MPNTTTPTGFIAKAIRHGVKDAMIPATRIPSKLLGDAMKKATARRLTLPMVIRALLAKWIAGEIDL